ncbi:MAG: oligosaccharide flippase family protein, partial [Elusimicrobiales bacterium]|nr:oligosaccharide flippase family protein [Elusimicrobiales bacterium]
PIYYLTCGMVLGQVLFPVWFFQGMERMKYITVLNITAKLIFTVAIFVFVHHMEDFLYVPLLNTLGYIVAGILSLWLIFRDFNISFNPPSLSDIKHHLKEGWDIFLANVIRIFYCVPFSTFFLGLFSNDIIVGYYSAANKIVQAIVSIITPLSQSIYPFIIKKMDESVKNGKNFIKKVIVIVGFITFMISMFFFAFTDFISDIILGHGYDESKLLIKIMAFLPFIVSLNTIYSNEGLLSLDGVKEFRNSMLYTSILSVVLSFLFVPLYQAKASASIILISEAFMLLYSYFFYKRLLNKNLKYEETK